MVDLALQSQELLLLVGRRINQEHKVIYDTTVLEVR